MKINYSESSDNFHADLYYRFGVVLSTGEAALCVTPQHTARILCDRLAIVDPPNDRSRLCREMTLTAIAEQTGRPESSLSEQDRLADLFPLRGRRASWRSLGLSAKPLMAEPGLERPRWVFGASAILTCIVAPVLFLLAVDGWIRWLTPLVIVGTGILITYLTRPLCRNFWEHFVTVGDLVEWMEREPVTIRGVPVPWTREQVLETVLEFARMRYRDDSITPDSPLPASGVGEPPQAALE